jgi:hypothetical protein
MRPRSKIARLWVALLLAVAPMGTVAPTPVLATAPANDNFADAQVLSGPLPITVSGTNLDATVEPGEPALAGGAAESSVWYAWTADVSGPVSMEACDSPLPARLGVYVGDSLASLTPVGDRPTNPCISNKPMLQLDVTAGTTYRIAVNGTFGEQAPFELRIRLMNPPANDDFADAEVLVGSLPLGDSGTLVDANPEPGEPLHGGRLAAFSVWYSWTPEASETVIIETCASEFGTNLDVYTGEAVDALTAVGQHLDGPLSCAGFNPTVRLNAIAGTSYRIAIDAVARPGTYELHVRHPNPPPNDAFADAVVLMGAPPVSVAGSNVEASKEPGEPLHGNNEGGSSVWYEWTAPTAGRFAFDACESNFISLVAIYTGADLSSLVEVSSRLNFFSCEPLSVDATAGTTYHIAIDGVLTNLGITQGSFTLAIRPLTAPVNDDFAARTILTGPLPILAEGTNRDASSEPGETTPGGTPGGASVWWSWTPTVSELVAIDTCPSDFDTTLAVYTGTELGTLSLVAANDDFAACQIRSLVTFQATAGTTYQIQVDGYQAATGDIALAIEGPPPNDDFSDAQVLSGDLPIVVSANNARATKEPGEPNHAGNVGGHSMWYAWTPTASATVQIGTCEDAVQGLIAVYTGDSLTTLTEVASNSRGCSPGAFVIIDAVAGTTYRIATDSFTGFFGTSYGPFTLRIAEHHPPANDDFADAEVLTGDLTIYASGSTVDATEEPGEPNHTSNAGGSSIWYAWTPTQSGSVGIDTCGSDFDTLLAVYSGSAVSSLTKLASNDDFTGCGRDSFLLFTATTGSTYHIAVDGFGRDQGQVLLHVRRAGPPANDDFADAAQLGDSLPVTVAGTTMEATREPAEPNHAGNRGIASIWYAWTAARPMPVTVDTCNATFDTLLGVYTGGALDALTEVASSDDSAACGDQSLVAFDAAGGRTYRIAIDGWTSTFGRWQVGYADLALRSACTETLTGPLFSTVKASNGVVCIHDAVVEGAIRVAPGAQLWLIDSQVIGPVTADRAGQVVMCGTSVDGPVRLVGGASVSLGDPILGCAPNLVDGTVTLKDTAGPSVIAGNTITGKLACSGNAPAPVDRGLPNQVLGPATGQCKSLAD